jgi:hypothetical protein
MMEYSFTYLSEIIYQSKTFREFLINTNPFYPISCNIVAWSSPILMASLIRPGYLALLFGVCISMFANYLDTTSSCFISNNACNDNDNEIGFYLDIPFGIIYSTIALFGTKWTLSGIQEYRKRRKS